MLRHRFALTACIVVLSYLCATSRQPLHDPIFFDLDRRLGFDWWAWRGFVVDRPLLNATFCALYASLGPQVLLSIFYLPAIGRTSQASELLLLYHDYRHCLLRSLRTLAGDWPSGRVQL